MDRTSENHCNASISGHSLADQSYLPTCYPSEEDKVKVGKLNTGRDPALMVKRTKLSGIMRYRSTPSFSGEVAPGGSLPVRHSHANGEALSWVSRFNLEREFWMVRRVLLRPASADHRAACANRRRAIPQPQSDFLRELAQ
jgi:hypothetical protein